MENLNSWDYLAFHFEKWLKLCIIKIVANIRSQRYTSKWAEHYDKIDWKVRFKVTESLRKFVGKSTNRVWSALQLKKSYRQTFSDGKKVCLLSFISKVGTLWWLWRNKIVLCSALTGPTELWHVSQNRRGESQRRQREAESDRKKRKDMSILRNTYTHLLMSCPGSPGEKHFVASHSPAAVPVCVCVYALKED